MEVDVILVSDFRFPGGTATAMAAEIEALSTAGYSVALLPIASDLFSAKRDFHSQINNLIKDRKAQLVTSQDKITASLCCLHHPAVFEKYPAAMPSISADKTLLIAHHPLRDNLGELQYDIDAIMRVCRDLFGAVTWAPVGPNVRKNLQHYAPQVPLTSDDWVNLIGAEAEITPRDGLRGSQPVLGRHSRPDPIKWPDTQQSFRAAYPTSPDIRVRLMGYSDSLDEIAGERADNWELLPFGAEPVADFLASLDYFSYFHSDAWIEAFGRAPLEAMSQGLVCFLPPSFEPIFKEGAVYCAPEDVTRLVGEFDADPQRYAEQSMRAVSVVRDLYGPQTAIARVNKLIGPPKERSTAKAKPQDTRPRVMYFTSNGIGMGHITRAMATARRLPDNCVPVIVTMTKAFDVVRDQGIAVEYLPYFRSNGLTHNPWQKHLTRTLYEIIEFHRPSVFVFDGNVPYRGMLDAFTAFPNIWKVWQRRGMWRPDIGEEEIELSNNFDLVIEPGETAAPVDRGLTAINRHAATQVAPIRYLDHDEMLPRASARSLIGLDDDATAIFLQLGSGNNYEIDELTQSVLDRIETINKDRKIQIVLAEWRISNARQSLPDHVSRLSTFPFSKYLNAFDYAVAMAGYNTFHENTAAGLPTLFLSNENPEHDEQWLRGDFGKVTGICRAARSFDHYAISRELEALADPTMRKAIRTKCLNLPKANGAHHATTILRNLAFTTKGHLAQRATL